MSGHPPENANRDSQASSNKAASDSGQAARRPTGLAGSFWFAFKAIEIRLRFVAILVGIGLVIGYWDTLTNHWDKWTRPASVATIALWEYYCAMHPSVVRGEPEPSGAIPHCPICGMPLSKRKKGELSQLPAGVISRVQLSPYRIELAGIETVEATHRPLTLDVRTVGYVAIDERRLSRIVVRAAGYVEKLYINESFAEVRQGDPLVEIYSPELYSAMQELLIARSGTSSQLAAIARERLRLLGVADEEIDQIVSAGKASSRLLIRSPHSGHVFVKHVLEGDRVEAGQMLFEVADLSTVWIEGEVYEKDAAMLQRGQAVEATVDAFAGRVLEGRVGLVHPHVETSTRTLRVRFELPNPGHVLRPGMFATVSLKKPMQEVEPFASVARSLRERNDGLTSEPNTENDDWLIAKQKVCPVTGAKLGSMGTPVRATANGQAVLLCCEACQDKLASQPGYYVGRLSTVSSEGVLAVPEQAVIDTGNQKIVYIERVPGLFEGVAVTLGPLAGGYYPVVDGLLSGDRVAAAGAFLVDAETRLDPAAASAYFGASGGPSSGSTPSSATGRTADGAAASSSGPSAKERANLAKLPEADRTLAEWQRTCPITDMPLGSMGVPYKMIVQGQPLFLCCKQCQDRVNKEPQAVLSKMQNATTR
jgi:Cu(I)/Ag(I) efflux system membrane fusion protein